VALPVLAADTTVVVDEMVCGKPADEGESLAMLERLSGRTHQVLYGRGARGSRRGELPPERERGALPDLSRAECSAYWHTGEPRDKAGGYAVQGRAAVFIERLSGSYSGVMGLPLFETAELLRAAGVPYCGTARAREPKR